MGNKRHRAVTRYNGYATTKEKLTIQYAGPVCVCSMSSACAYSVVTDPTSLTEEA